MLEAAEGIAAGVSSASGLDDRPNCDPAVIAVAYLDLHLVPQRGRGSRLDRDRIFYPARASACDAAYFIAHELGHWLARDARMQLSRPEEEVVASRIGCALLLPRIAFLRDARATGGDVEQLVRLWPLTTPTIVRRRIAELIIA